MTTYRRCEELVEYLASDSAPSIEKLRELANIKNATQIQHWISGIRRPNPKHAVAIEKATAGAVPRHVWYPNNEWRSIWPEYRLPRAGHSAQDFDQVWISDGNASPLGPQGVFPAEPGKR